MAQNYLGIPLPAFSAGDITMGQVRSDDNGYGGVGAPNDDKWDGRYISRPQFSSSALSALEPYGVGAWYHLPNGGWGYGSANYTMEMDAQGNPVRFIQKSPGDDGKWGADSWAYSNGAWNPTGRTQYNTSDADNNNGLLATLGGAAAGAYFSPAGASSGAVPQSVNAVEAASLGTGAGTQGALTTVGSQAGGQAFNAAKDSQAYNLANGYTGADGSAWAAADAAQSAGTMSPQLMNGLPATAPSSGGTPSTPPKTGGTDWSVKDVVNTVSNAAKLGGALSTLVGSSGDSPAAPGAPASYHTPLTAASPFDDLVGRIKSQGVGDLSSYAGGSPVGVMTSTPIKNYYHPEGYDYFGHSMGPSASVTSQNANVFGYGSDKPINPPDKNVGIGGGSNMARGGRVKRFADGGGYGDDPEYPTVDSPSTPVSTVDLTQEDGGGALGQWFGMRAPGEVNTAPRLPTTGAATSTDYSLGTRLPVSKERQSAPADSGGGALGALKKLWDSPSTIFTDPKVFNTGMGVLSLLYALKHSNDKTGRGYMSSAEQRAAMASPYNSWTPAQAATAQGFQNRNFTLQPLTTPVQPRVGEIKYFAARGGQPWGPPGSDEDDAPMGALGHLAGPGGGQADDVNARLSHGEYVIDADVVSALGDGNNAEGARKLDEMRENIRRQKRAAPSDKIPPKAKDPDDYMPRRKPGKKESRRG